MNQDNPSVTEILDTVQEFIKGRDSAPENKFHGRVASYLLSIAGRELTQDNKAIEKKFRKYAEVLGIKYDSPVAFYTSLSNNVRSAAFDDRFEEVLDLTLDLVVDKVRVVRPDVLDKMHR